MGRSRRKPLVKYDSFLRHLRSLCANAGSRAQLKFALDGQANAELTGIQRSTRREFGIYFTPRTLSRRLVRLCLVRESRRPLIYDPACGAGDLLVGAARLLPVKASVQGTLRAWGKQLAGTDVFPEMIQATRLRLALLASMRLREQVPTSVSLAKLLPRIRVGDGLRVRRSYSEATHVLMNPPYSTLVAPENTPWRKGTTSRAALFVWQALRHMRRGGRLVALLPDVLRSGSSYEAWRKWVAAESSRVTHHVYGLFSSDCDVDVFGLSVDRRAADFEKIASVAASDRSRLGDLFSVNVGAVVPHRHRERGDPFPYLHVGNVAPWKEIREVDEVRRFEGRAFTPPFVVVRRTSRPGDRWRAAASVVVTTRDQLVAVENHLLVLTPKSHTIKDCRRLQRVLKSEETNRLLDKSIRCRHLTVRSVSDLPFPD